MNNEYSDLGRSRDPLPLFAVHLNPKILKEIIRFQSELLDDIILSDYHKPLLIKLRHMNRKIRSLLQKLGENLQINRSALHNEANQRLEHILDQSLRLHQIALLLPNQIDKATCLVNFRMHSLVLEHVFVVLEHSL